MRRGRDKRNLKKFTCGSQTFGGKLFQIQKLPQARNTGNTSCNALDDAGLTSKQISTRWHLKLSKKNWRPIKITVQHDTIKDRNPKMVPNRKKGKTVIYRSVNGQPYVSHRVVEQKDFYRSAFIAKEMYWSIASSWSTAMAGKVISAKRWRCQQWPVSEVLLFT